MSTRASDKDGPADLGDECTDIGLANQPVILYWKCTSILLPGVSMLLPVSIQLLRAF